MSRKKQKDEEKKEKPVFGSETAPSLADRGVYLFDERDGRLVPVQAANRLECAYSPKAFAWAAPAEVALRAQIESPWSAGEFAWCTYDYLGEPNHTGHEKRDYWPARSSYWGLCDLAGLRKDRFYLYQSRWSEKPVVHLLPDWTMPGRERPGMPVWRLQRAATSTSAMPMISSTPNFTPRASRLRSNGNPTWS